MIVGKMIFLINNTKCSSIILIYYNNNAILDLINLILVSYHNKMKKHNLNGAYFFYNIYY